MGLRLGVRGWGCLVEGEGFRIGGWGFRVGSLGFRVWGFTRDSAALGQDQSLLGFRV